MVPKRFLNEKVGGSFLVKIGMRLFDFPLSQHYVILIEFNFARSDFALKVIKKSYLHNDNGVYVEFQSSWMLNGIMKLEKFNNSEMIEFNQVELNKMFFYFLIALSENGADADVGGKGFVQEGRSFVIILTYKLKREFHADIFRRQTDETRGFRSREFLPSLGCGLAVTIQPAIYKQNLIQFSKRIHNEIMQTLAIRQPAWKLFFFIE